MAQPGPSLGGRAAAKRPAFALPFVGAIVLAGYSACLFVNLPGHFSPDSLWQLGQGRSGVYDDWHPPVMAWLLGLADRLVRGAPLFMVFDATLFSAGLMAFVALARRPRLVSALVVALVMASPIVLIYQGIVWKDVLFADAAMAGFAALAWAASIWRRPAARGGAIVVAFALFSLACLVRQNGAIIPFCGVAALFAISWNAEKTMGPSPGAVGRSARRALAAAALTALAVGAADYALSRHSDGEPQDSRQLERLQVYDLAGAVRADPAASLATIHRSNPILEQFIRTEAAPGWQAASADYLTDLPGARAMLMSSSGAVTRQWAALIVRRPALYLELRWEVFLAVLTTPPSDDCPMVMAGVDSGYPELLAAAGLRPRYNGRDHWDDDYQSAFMGTPVLSHLLYGALAIILAGWAMADLKRAADRGPLIGVIAMLTAAILTTASFFVISNACDYRYLYFLDVAAMGALAHRAARR